MGHFGVTAIKHYAENAANSLVVDLDRLIKAKMDYFALGDYHTPTDFGQNIRYSGSIDRFGFDEMQNEPQVLLVEIDEDTKEVTVTELKLNVRPMIELKAIDAKDKTAEELNIAIVDRIQKANLTDKIVRLRVKNMPNHIKAAINDDKVRELTDDALYFRLEFIDKSETSKGVKSSGTRFESVEDGWMPFIASLPEDGTFDKQKLAQLGMEKIREALENAAG
jgi:DNA repair exonuclease SbcCD nuclease subunit